MLSQSDLPRVYIKRGKMSEMTHLNGSHDL